MSRVLQPKVHHLIQNHAQNHMTSSCVLPECFESTEALGNCSWIWKESLLEHAKHGKSHLVLKAYGQLNMLNFIPNGYILVCVIKACTSQCAYTHGKLIHVQVADCGFESQIFIGSSLINLYFKSGSPEDAQKVFDGLEGHDIVIWNAMITGYAQIGCAEKMLELFQQVHMSNLQPNIATWNAVIGGCAHNKLSEEALRLFRQMMIEGCMPEDVTFASVLNACTNMTAQDLGKFIHVHLIEDRQSSDIFLGNTLINLYVKCRNLKLAHIVFESLPQQDLVTWNVLISGYCLHGNCSEALELFHDMQKKGHNPDLVTWNALLTGHLQHGHSEEVFLLFKQMEEQGRKPDAITLVTVLKACSSMAALKKGKLVHAYLLETDSASDMIVYNALIDMYAKCGSLKDACKVFKVLPKRNLVSWNSIIAANSIHNHYEAVLECFENMQLEGFQPDEITLLCIVSAYGRAGSVNPYRGDLVSLLKLDSLSSKPEQYITMVDLLGREGFLQDAQRLLKVVSMENNIQALSCLLTHSRTYGDIQLGRRCFDQVLTLDDQYTFAYETMAALYADQGMWESMAHVQCLHRRAQGARSNIY